MDPDLTISLTLCHQFQSDFYNSRELKTCLVKAAESAEELLGNINIVFEDIEDEMNDNIIHENVVNSIRKSHIVIFELSDVNPNVLYELGIANGLKKPVIIIREKTSTTTIPTDINQFIYLTYDKNKLNTFHNILSEKIKKALEKYNEIDFISKNLQAKILDNYIDKNINFVFKKLETAGYIKTLKTKNDFSNEFENIIKTTKMNVYYIGTLGFLSQDQRWFDFYKNNFDNNKIFSRVVYILSLDDFYKVYDDVDMLIDYCLWLSINYYLVKENIITISKSNDISIWKNGLSFIVVDEEEILISTGSFQNEFNNKGFILKNSTIAKMFKEYAKILAIKSKTVKARDFYSFFTLNGTVNKKALPETIAKGVKELKDDNSIKNLKIACTDFIENALNI